MYIVLAARKAASAFIAFSGNFNINKKLKQALLQQFALSCFIYCKSGSTVFAIHTLAI